MSSRAPTPPAGLPAPYTEYADWWPLLSAPGDYEEEAEIFRRMFFDYSDKSPSTMLELGCGGGNNASHLKRSFSLTLSDLALFVPDQLRETFKPRTSHGGHDEGQRGMRYLEWVWDPDPRDQTCLADFAYLFRHPGGAVTVAQDRHLLGLFARADWLRLLKRVGFSVRALPFAHSEVPMVRVR